VKTNDDREWRRVLNYLEENAQERELALPIKPLAELLQNNFGWSVPSGKKRALAILKQLEESGLVRCGYDGRGTPRTVRFLAQEKPKVVAREEKKEEIAPALQRPKPTTRWPPRTASHEPKQIIVGDHNEKRFYLLARNFVDVLGNVLPGVFTKMNVTRSGRHLPERGEIDVADHHGEDISIKIGAELEDGSSLDGRMVYDVKSSSESARRFNENIYFQRHEIETGVIFKRAIAVNPDRGDQEIVSEILTDMIEEIGLRSLESHKERLLDLFEP